MSRPDLNPWHEAVLRAADLIDAARHQVADPQGLDTALRILDALIGGLEPDAADLETLEDGP